MLTDVIFPSAIVKYPPGTQQSQKLVLFSPSVVRVPVLLPVPLGFCGAGFWARAVATTAAKVREMRRIFISVKRGMLCRTMAVAGAEESTKNAKRARP